MKLEIPLVKFQASYGPFNAFSPAVYLRHRAKVLTMFRQTHEVREAAGKFLDSARAAFWQRAGSSKPILVGIHSRRTDFIHAMRDNCDGFVPSVLFYNDAISR